MYSVAPIYAALPFVQGNAQFRICRDKDCDKSVNYGF
jgi:hypothetical protein